MTGCSLHAVVTEGGTLSSLRDGKSVRHQYYRLDLDVRNVGAIYSHPHPHIHTTGGPTPRFDARFMKSGNLVVDFLDFIYRTHFHEQWMEWAHRTWGQYAHKRGYRDPFVTVAAAFAERKPEVVTQRFSADVERMKRCWRGARDRMYPLRAQTIHRALLYDL